MEWIFGGVSILLVGGSGLFSGLTLGLLSFDPLHLQVLERASPSPSIREDAKKVQPLLERYHQLLVALILGNMLCAEALPIFVDQIVPAYLAILLSVTMILFFGEIFPQAICAKYGLRIGAFVRYPLHLLLLLTWPINWPLGWFLDRLLGKKERLLSGDELSAFIEIHREAGIFPAPVRLGTSE